ncbi:MAG: hypothetical protein GOMPHAMPRED_002482 [Gomphillus americanus]|uniref:Uncharacterized protein n=1 Tax=Gomphillus americanus TaxID=1940652 RepID=A0A8H3FJG0_9LECA|nr:MAG: hypothetical protein GOMPHAMPRED_002482 [Gomphillus americanus]
MASTVEEEFSTRLLNFMATDLAADQASDQAAGQPQAPAQSSSSSSSSSSPPPQLSSTPPSSAQPSPQPLVDTYLQARQSILDQMSLCLQMTANLQENLDRLDERHQQQCQQPLQQPVQIQQLVQTQQLVQIQQPVQMEQQVQTQQQVQVEQLVQAQQPVQAQQQTQYAAAHIPQDTVVYDRRTRSRMTIEELRALAQDPTTSRQLRRSLQLQIAQRNHRQGGRIQKSIGRTSNSSAGPRP